MTAPPPDNVQSIGPLAPNPMLASKMRAMAAELIATAKELIATAELYEVRPADAGTSSTGPAPFRLAATNTAGPPSTVALAGIGAPRLPNPRIVRRRIRQRQLRARFFDGDIFADPAWDMLLDLTAARAERTRVSVTSLCIASGVPPTTALRWIGEMSKGGLLARTEDGTDRRRAFIALTEGAVGAMSRYFGALGKDGDMPV